MTRGGITCGRIGGVGAEVRSSFNGGVGENGIKGGWFARRQCALYTCLGIGNRHQVATRSTGCPPRLYLVYHDTCISACAYRPRSVSLFSTRRDPRSLQRSARRATALHNISPSACVSSFSSTCSLNQTQHILPIRASTTPPSSPHLHVSISFAQHVAVRVPRVSDRI